MGWLAPWYLAGLAAVTLPIWLHLLRRHKSTPLKFSSLMFFERRLDSSVRRRRLEHLVLLALRALVLVLLALAFADPFVRRPAPVAGPGTRLLVLAIDRSFSMRAGDRLSRAKQEASRVLSSLRPGEKATVLAFDLRVQQACPSTNDQGRLQAAIASVEASDSRSSFGELARFLRTLAAPGAAPLEVHLFSDMQKASLPEGFAELRLPSGAKLWPHPTAESPTENWAVESAQAPARIFGPQKVKVQATLAGFTTPARTLEAALRLDGRLIGSRTVEVPASGRAAVEFAQFEVPYGFHRGEVTASTGDGLKEDDRFLFSVERSEPAPLLFVHEERDRRSPVYFRSAVDAAMPFAYSIETATPAALGGRQVSGYALVVLSDAARLPEDWRRELEKYVRAGGGLLVLLGPSSAAGRTVPVAGDRIVESGGAEGGLEKFQSVTWVDAAHPAVVKADRWEGVRFYRAAGTDAPAERVLARLTGGTPLLVERPMEEGRVLVFASTFDNIANDFPLRPGFVPVVEQLVRYLDGAAPSRRQATVDSVVELRAGRNTGAAVEVFDPAGARALSLAEAASASSYQFPRAGFFEIRAGSGRRELVAVNPDRKESDLSTVPAEALSLWQNTGREPLALPSGDGEQEQVRRLWWYAVLALLLLAVAESFTAAGYLQAQREAA